MATTFRSSEGSEQEAASAASVLAAIETTFPGTTEVTLSSGDVADADCWRLDRHRNQHQPHPNTGRIVCFACHPPADTGRESPFRMTHVTEWTKGSFRGGPLDGQRRDVPKHCPAFVRWHADNAVHWYVVKPKTARTYVHIGVTPSEGRRSDRQLTLGDAPAAKLMVDASIVTTMEVPSVASTSAQIEKPALIDLETLASQLAAIAGDEPATSFIELRALDFNDQRHEREWINVRDPDRARKAADFIERTRSSRSVYIGCAPRARRRGTLDDVERAHVLWGDCDSPQSTARLFEFTPAPSFVFTSGRAGHVHFLYVLQDAIPATWVRRANRRLALALGADMAPTHAAATLRPVGSINHRNGETTTCAYADRLARYTAEQIIGHLPDEPERLRHAASPGPRAGMDGLLTTVRNAPAGTDRGYNVTLHWAACRCVEHIARGELDAETAYEALYEVGLEVDLGDRATRATLRSAGLT